MTSLIGRLADLERIVDFVQSPSVRWVTLIGPGGVGKTRLAIAVAEALASERGGRICWIDLTPISDPRDVLVAVAEAVGLQEATPEAAGQVSERLADLLSIGRWLLVIDNLEHVHTAAPAISALQRIAGQLSVLATSRVPLRLQGEQRIQIAPLPWAETATALTTAPAIELFIQRARQVDSRFQPDEIALGQIREICQRLDGLPLALELAAGLLERLSLDELTLLVAGDQTLPPAAPIDAPDRHQSLTTTFAWSYHLLSATEAEFYRRLSVFPSLFDVEVATAIARSMSGPSFAPARLLGQLEQASMIQRAAAGGPPRWRLLQPLRTFAREQCLAAGEWQSAAGAMADWCLELAERHTSAAFMPEQDAALDELDRNRPNIAAAFAWFRETSRPAYFARLAGALRTFWYLRAHYAEGAAMLTEALALPLPNADPALRGRLHQGRAMLHLAQGQMQPALDEFLTAEPLLLAGNARAREIAIGRLGASTAAFNLGNRPHAVSLLDEALAAVRDDDPLFFEALSIASSANHAFLTGIQGDLAGARLLFEHTREQQERTGVTWYLTIGWLQRGMVEEMHGYFDRAIEAYRTGWRIARAANRDLRLVADAVAGLASVALKRGDLRRAAQLLGAEEFLRVQIGGPIAYITSLDDQHVTTWKAIEAGLEPATFAELATSGAALDDTQLERIIAAIGASEPEVEPPGDKDRKRQVLPMVAQGMSDKQIARELHLSERTVQSIVSQLRRDFGAANRPALIAEAIRRGAL